MPREKQFLEEKSSFWSKIKILRKNINFCLKLKFWGKIKILAKNQNFGPEKLNKNNFEETNFMLENLVKNWNFGEKCKSDQKRTF